MYMQNSAGTEMQLTSDKKKANPTISPDGNFASLYQDNDLYSYNLAAKKKQGLPARWKRNHLNGYASWCTWKRSSGGKRNTVHSGGAPDSKHIAFFHSDESQVRYSPLPMRPAARRGGKRKISKVGDPNPEVKVGVW